MMASETSTGGFISNLSDTFGTSENALRLLLSVLAGQYKNYLSNESSLKMINDTQVIPSPLCTENVYMGKVM